MILKQQGRMRIHPDSRSVGELGALAFCCCHSKLPPPTTISYPSLVQIISLGAAWLSWAFWSDPHKTEIRVLEGLWALPEALGMNRPQVHSGYWPNSFPCAHRTEVLIGLRSPFLCWLLAEGQPLLLEATHIPSPALCVAPSRISGWRKTCASNLPFQLHLSDSSWRKFCS